MKDLSSMKFLTKKRVIFSLLPVLFLLGFVLVYPTVMTIIGSFMQWEGFDMVGFAGLKNYVKIFSDSAFLNLKNLLTFPPHPHSYGAFLHNFIWVLIFVPVTMSTGLLFAVLTKGKKGESVLKAMVLLAMATPLVVAGVIIFFSLSKDAGMVNALLRAFGLGGYAQSWIMKPITALLSLIFGSIWIFTGLSMLIYSSGLDTIPEELKEAAQLDGASQWQVFWRVTFPLLKPAHMTAFVILLIWNLKMFSLVYVTTGGGPGQSSTIMSILLYKKAFYQLKVGEGYAIATILAVITFLISAFLLRKGSE